MIAYMKTKESIALCIQQNYMFNAILYTTYSLPKVFLLKIWKIFNKNTYICEKSAIEINETENL